MTNLKILDLSQNSIRYLSKDSFKGLRLTSLYLNNIRGIQFSPNAFHGMTTKSLDLGSNTIREITSEMLVSLQPTLRKLYLADNLISRLDSDLWKLFSKLETLRLQSNPFMCDCQSKWLKRFYDEHRDIMEDDGQANIRCTSPSNVAGQAFQRLTTADFSCKKPSLSAAVSINKLKALLSCTSRGNPPPTLFWFRPNGIISEAPPIMGRSINNNDIEVSIDQLNSFGQYTCIASNEGGNISLSVNLEWPLNSQDNEIAAVGTPCPRVAGSSWQQNFELIMEKETKEVDSDGEVGIFFVKYFSLIDLIAAIFGTFLSTLLVTIIILHFCVYRQASNRSPYEVSTETAGYNTGSTDKNTNFSIPTHPTLPSRPLPFYHQLSNDHHYTSTSIDESEEFLYNSRRGSPTNIPSCKCTHSSQIR